MSTPHDPETRTNQMLNRLRAAVLGANDGIVSVSGVVLGVAGATDDTRSIFVAGVAALVAGALSMAVGEYVSVSSQSDAEHTYIEQERRSLKQNPREEFEELVQNYKARGVSEDTARQVAKELSSKNPLKAHLEIEFGLHEDDINSPIQAAVASLISFILGGIIPLIAVVVSSDALRISITVSAVIIALLVTGYISASFGGARRGRAMLRVVIGGILAMAITYGVGYLFGTIVK